MIKPSFEDHHLFAPDLVRRREPVAVDTAGDLSSVVIPPVPLNHVSAGTLLTVHEGSHPPTLNIVDY